MAALFQNTRENLQIEIFNKVYLVYNKKFSVTPESLAEIEMQLSKVTVFAKRYNISLGVCMCFMFLMTMLHFVIAIFMFSLFSSLSHELRTPSCNHVNCK